VAQTVINQINSTLTGTLPIQVEQHGYLPGQGHRRGIFHPEHADFNGGRAGSTPDTVPLVGRATGLRALMHHVPRASALQLSDVAALCASHQVSGMMVGVPVQLLTG